MAAVTVTAPYEDYQGNPLRVVPIRTTATEGTAEAVGPKEGLRHICLKVVLAATGDTYTLGRPVVSAAYHSATAVLTGEVVWDPDDATGKITIAITGGAGGAGWLHIWSYD